MKRTFKKLIPLVVFATLWSCDCMVTASGIVLDENSKTPLENVLVRNLLDSELGSKTKSDGAFSRMEVGRAEGKCPEFNLEFSKEGYITDTIFVENATPITVYLKKK